MNRTAGARFDCVKRRNDSVQVDCAHQFHLDYLEVTFAISLGRQCDCGIMFLIKFQCNLISYELLN